MQHRHQLMRAPLTNTKTRTTTGPKGAKAPRVELDLDLETMEQATTTDLL
jgi:hypothetical protein